MRPYRVLLLNANSVGCSVFKTQHLFLTLTKLSVYYGVTLDLTNGPKYLLTESKMVPDDSQMIPNGSEMIPCDSQNVPSEFQMFLNDFKMNTKWFLNQTEV